MNPAAFPGRKWNWNWNWNTAPGHPLWPGTGPR